jgi:hypothetical protein
MAEVNHTSHQVTVGKGECCVRDDWKRTRENLLDSFSGAVNDIFHCFLNCIDDFRTKGWVYVSVCVWTMKTHCVWMLGVTLWGKKILCAFKMSFKWQRHTTAWSQCTGRTQRSYIPQFVDCVNQSTFQILGLLWLEWDGTMIKYTEYVRGSRVLNYNWT